MGCYVAFGDRSMADGEGEGEGEGKLRANVPNAFEHGERAQTERVAQKAERLWDLPCCARMSAS